ncbi:unnamed protein product [Cuscuta campestris]|uniref:PB1-like domain-containing protein n=1 Tax=Cuscuta campestris TaxID=132261 RepID=A0A484NJN8_9ASTE|nr:unnamed protein product [Cuscuta campestris]
MLVYDIIMHHDGVLGEFGYYDEKKFLLTVDVDRMCMKYLDKLLAINGINGLVRYYWRDHRTPYHNGLKPLQFADDTWEMSKCGCEYGSVHLYVESVGEAKILKIWNELNTPTPKPKPGVVIEDLDDESPPITHPLKPKKREAGSSLRRVLAICQAEPEGILHEEDKGEPSSVIGDEPSPVDFQQEDKSEPTVVEENKSDPQEDKSEPPVLEEDKSEPPVVEDERMNENWGFASDNG